MTGRHEHGAPLSHSLTTLQCDLHPEFLLGLGKAGGPKTEGLPPSSSIFCFPVSLSGLPEEPFLQDSKTSESFKTLLLENET